MFTSRAKRWLLAFAATALIVAAVPGASLASSDGCSTVVVYGAGFANCVHIDGGGLWVNYARVSADLPLQGNTFPSFVGCQAHVEFYNKLGGRNKRDWNSPTVDCGVFNAAGRAAIISLNQAVPAGKYCGRVWISNNGKGYKAAAPACMKIKR